MSVQHEARTLHFDFSSFSREREFSFLGGDGRRVVLKRYVDHPSKLDEHRARNAALRLIPEDKVSNLTHFCEAVPMNASKMCMRRVVFPSLDDHPLPEIAMVFAHIPRTYVIAAHTRFYRSGRRPARPYALHAYGTPHEHYERLLRDGRAGEPQDVHFDLPDIQPPGVTAQNIVLNHPELGSVNPGVWCYVTDQYLNPMVNQDMSDFVQYLQNSQPGEGNPFVWYNKSWVQWADDSGKMVPAEVDTTIKYKGGATVTNWPKPPNCDYQGMPTYNLTDEYDPPQGNPANQSVISAAGPTVQGALLATKNDVTMNGLLWTKQNGVTQTTPSAPTVVNAPAPRPRARGAAAAAVGAGSAAKGFTVKNLTSSYGVDIYDLSFDFNKKTVTLPLKNWPSRYLGAYVQFLKQDGTPIKRSDIKGWNDPVPDILKKLVQPSDTKNYLTWLSSGNAIFGIPVPPLTQTADLNFLWPDDASRALVLLGGLGCASGFKDWDGDVDVVGVLGTGIMNYGVGVIMLGLNVYVINPFIKGLMDKDALSFYVLAATIGADLLIIGIGEKDTSTGKMILSKLAGIAASSIFGAVMKKAIGAAARQFLKVFFELSAEFMAELTAEEAIEAVPVAGWALRVVSIAADLAGLAATTIECILSPATYSLEVLHTMDLTVTVKPDPTHGKPGFNPVWPAVSDHYVIQVKYPSGNNQEGGTTYTQAGPMPGQHDAPIVVTFPGIPAGGKIQVVANIYSASDWQAGTWNSGWIDAQPDSNDELKTGGSIVEALVPLTASTSYSQKQAVGYNNDPKIRHFWLVSAFSVDAGLMPDFDKGGSPDAAISSAFSANGNTLSSAATIKVNTKMQSWTVTDSQSGATFAVAAKQLFVAKVFQMSLSAYQGALNAGGATPSSITDKFNNEGRALPAGTQITVVTSGQKWMIGLPGQPWLYQLDTNGSNIDVKQTGYELTVQNTAQPNPPLPQIYPLPASPSGNALGALQNIIINDKQFQLGYAYLASGQNMPLDNQPGNTNVPMYGMQSISTLGQPQDQIIQPTKGFSQPTFLAYDQFGLTPLFFLDAGYAAKLKNGPVDPDVAKQFAAFGYTLPANSVVATITANKDWSIGVSGQTPIYELRLETVIDQGKQKQQLDIYSFPVPTLDNFFLEPQPVVPQKPLNFYLRGVKLDLPPGEYTFNYSTPQDPNIWGIFQNQTPFQEMAVHPNGYVVGLDNTNAKMFVLKLPANAVAPAQAPLAMPLAGKGGREGLLDSPQAMTIAADGRILVLETGTLYIDQPRVQAFDVKGNPVPSFSVNQPSFQITSGADTIISQLDNREISQTLLQLFQQNFMPALAAKAVLDSTLNLKTVAADLDKGTVDSILLAGLQRFGLANDQSKPTDFTVTVTTKGKLWFMTDTVSKAVYDVRFMLDPNTGLNVIDVFLQFGLAITIRSPGNDWKIDDSVNGMTFEIKKDAKSSTLTVQQLSSWMPLRKQTVQGSLSYLDIASETKGYIYVLGVIDNNYNSSKNPKDLVFQLDIYNPDGSALLTKPQPGVNAGKITVDQYRSLFSLNFNVVIGPNTRTEPGVSQWIPSTPTPAT